MPQKRLEQAATQRGKRDRPAFDSHRKQAGFAQINLLKVFILKEKV